MKRYDSLRALFWLLAAGLSTAGVSASPSATLQAQNSNQSSVNIGDQYSNLGFYTATGDTLVNVGDPGHITLNAGGNTPTLSIGGSGGLQENFTFSATLGPLTLQLAPTASQTLTSSGSYVSTNASDILEIAGGSGSTVNLTGDLSAFQSHLKHTSGALNINSSTAVMTSGGLLSIGASSAGTTLTSTAARDVGNLAHIIDIASGKTLTLSNDGSHIQTIKSKIQGAGSVQVDSGDHRLEGSPLTNTGGFSVNNAGTLRFKSPTSAALSSAGTSKIKLENTSDATYAGDLNLQGTGGLEIDASSSTITLTGAATSLKNVTVTSGTLVLQDSSIDGAATYNGDGTLAFNNTISKTVSGAMTGGIGIVKQGSGALTVANLNTTGPVNIENGSLETQPNAIGVSFLGDSSNAVNIASGAEFVYKIGSNGVTLNRPLSGAGVFKLDVASNNNTVTLNNDNITVGTIELTNPSSSNFYLDFTGNLPTQIQSDITTADNNHKIRFSLPSTNEREYAGAITGAGSVTLAGSSKIKFSGLSNFTGNLILSSGTQAQLEEASINDTRIYDLSGAGSKLILNPSATHTFGADVITGTAASAIVDIQGGVDSTTQISLSGAQTFQGIVNLTEANINLTGVDALKEAASVTLFNNSKLITTANQEIKNLVTTSPHAELVIGAGTITLKPTAGASYAGKISSTGAGALVHNSTAVQTLSGDLSSFSRDITAASTGLLKIESDITLGLYTNTYTSANPGSLEFSHGSLINTLVAGHFSLATDFVTFNNAMLKYAPTAAGAIKQITGTGGISVGMGGLDVETDFGRTIVNSASKGIQITQDSVMNKKGFGDFELSGDLLIANPISSSQAINVEAGTLKLSGTALSGTAATGLTSDISVAGQSVLGMILPTGGNTTFSRVIDGQGSLALSTNATDVGTSTLRSLNLSSTSKLLHKGNLSISGYSALVLNDDAVVWQPGSASQIAIDSAGGLTLRGQITPDGSTFNPYFTGPSGTIKAAGTTNIYLHSSAQSLIVGNQNDTLEIAASASVWLRPTAGKTAQFKYDLTAIDNTAVFGLQGEGNLSLEGDLLSNYQGTVHNNSTSGHLLLKNPTIKTTTNGTRFHFGTSASALTTFDLSTTSNNLTLGANNNMATAAGKVAKKGLGRLVFDGTPNIDSWTGTFDIYAGDVEFHDMARNSAAQTNVHKGARLIVWRDTGAAASNMIIGSVNLESGSSLYLTDRDWTTSTSAGDPSHLATVVSNQITAAAGSEMVFVVDPSTGVTGTSGASFANARLQILRDYSAHPNDITAPLYIRLAPLNGTDYTDKSVFSLIKFNSAASATSFASKVKLRPTIRGLASYEAGLTVSNNTTKSAQLYLANSGSAVDTLVVQINELGFAPGLRAAAKNDFSLAAYPTGTYTVGYFLESLMAQNFAAYSGLDGLLSAVTMHHQNYDYHMSLLQPASYSQATQLFHHADMLLAPYTQQAFDGLAEQQRWSDFADKNGMHRQLAEIASTIHQHQNLQTDSHVKSRGALQSWNSSIKGMHLMTQHATQKVDADVVGMAWRIGPTAALAYQHISAQLDYKARDGQTSGHRETTTAQAFAQASFGSISMASTSMASLHQHQHQRDMAIEVATGLIDRWSARSCYNSTELQQDFALSYHNMLTKNSSVDIGLKTQAQYHYTPKFAESGADNLNLVIESQHQAAVIATPTVAFDVRSIEQKGWSACRFSIGYQKELLSQRSMTYGFNDFDVRNTIEQQQAPQGFIAGFETSYSNGQGLSFQMHYQTLAAETHQGQLSVSYEF